MVIKHLYTILWGKRFWGRLARVANELRLRWIVSMLIAPTKPAQDMTEDELRQWKEWLLEQGLNPRPIQVNLPRSGSVYTYDRVLAAVVERTPDGSRYLVEVRDGKITRARGLDRDPIITSLMPANSGDDPGSSAIVAFVAMIAISALIILAQGIGPNGVRTHPYHEAAPVVTLSSSHQ